MPERENLSNGCWCKPTRKTTIAGCWYMYQPPNTLSYVGAFFNISRLNKSRQYFKMVEEKNNVIFSIREQFKIFSLCKKKFHQMKWNILWNFGWGIWDPSVLHNKEEWKRNSVKKSGITNWRMLAYMVVKSSSHVEKEQEKPR